MEFTQAPTTWQQAKLIDVAIVNMGQSPSSADVNDEGYGLAFFQGKAEFGKLHPEPRKFCTAPKKIAEKDDILLSVRAPVGPTNVANQKSVIGRGLAAIHAEKSALEPRFLLYFFRFIEPWMSQQGTGSTFKAISGAFLKELNTVLPPLAEQKAIADKLDTLLAQVDNTKARLERTPEILKRFRQSVLTAAVSGRLTEAWRGTIAKKSFEAFDIPKDWLASKIGEIGDVKGGKRLPKGEELTAEKTGYKYIRAGQLKNGTVISGEDNRNIQLYITSSTKKQIVRYTVNSGDAYLTIVGASIGDAGIIPESHNGANLTENAAKITNYRADIEPRYLKLWLRSEYLQGLIRLETKSAAQGKLALARIKTLPFPCPPYEEQTEIVRRVDQLFAYADTVERQVNSALERINQLTQSILAKAFRGELTAQWREDNPELISGENSAEALLERIKAERAAQAPTKCTRKKATT